MINLKTLVTENNKDRILGNSLNESYENIMEKLITVGGKAYPNFGNVVIMAGGAGSGKGFVKDKLLGVEGKTFDVDELKKMAKKSDSINKEVKRKFGVDLKGLDLKNPDNVSLLHGIVGDQMNLPRKSKASMYSSIMGADPKRKPNLIFDVTLKDLGKLNRISNDVTRLGYDKKNVHIVWVINDIDIAKEQNRDRDRVVPEDILVMTHRGVSTTMNEILTGSVNVTDYMDGDIWLIFNKRNVDSITKTSEIPYKPNSQTLPSNPKNKQPMVIKDANTVLVKKSGGRIRKERLDFRVVKEILDYIPNQKDLKFR